MFAYSGYQSNITMEKPRGKSIFFLAMGKKLSTYVGIYIVLGLFHLKEYGRGEDFFSDPLSIILYFSIGPPLPHYIIIAQTLPPSLHF